MSTKSFWTEGNLALFDPTHNPNFLNGPWQDCPMLAYLCDPTIAHYLMEDFDNIQAATLAGWTATQATTGTWAITDEVGGVARADCNSVTQGQGINVQKLGENFKCAAGKDLWFEARFRVTDTFDDCELFVGLAITDTTVLVSQANTATDYIGWECVTNDGICLFETEKAGVTVTGKAAMTLEEATWAKVAFKVNGVTDIEHWVDDVKLSTTQITANIPVVEMTPTIVCQSGGTADPLLDVDYIRCFQLR